ncbi:MAG TPA: Holliday junction resolvase RuvX [Rhabdochlamydiaceae bacterium]|nr:Holliday junction resolvase RuvX [Rhabdochlamydiaceae bacterium]
MKNRVAGIDFGLQRIGLALSDERHIFASPFKMVQTAKNLKDTAALLANELSAYPLQCLVIGLPLHLNGKESEMSLKTRELADLLKALLNIEIILWDERLSSLQVERTLKEAQISRKNRKALLDKTAAAAILQNYLDSKNIF